MNMNIKKIFLAGLVFGLSACGSKEQVVKPFNPSSQNSGPEQMDCAQALTALQQVDQQKFDSYRKGVFNAYYCKP